MNTKKKVILLITTLGLLNFVGIFTIANIGVAKSNTEEINNPITIDILDLGPKIRYTDYSLDLDTLNPMEETEVESTMKTTETTDYTVVDTKQWLSLDDQIGGYFFTDFELWDVGVGTTMDIWVQTDLSWLPVDPQNRTTPVVTGEQVEYMLEEFETNIYPKDTDYFGSENYHDGNNSLLVDWGYFPEEYFYDASGKNVMLVSNIRDEGYYTDFPYYIAGFFSPTMEMYFDRNIISIDAYEWENRIGPDAERAYLYEGVVAHEYQHLIHSDYFVEEPSATFMNEGCSMYAEILCGYPTPWAQINTFFATPDNSLIEWEDQTGINILADYGAATLWATYLVDQFGTNFLKNYVQAGKAGIKGINLLLEEFEMDFDSAYRDWTIANLIHSDFPGCGKYNYKSIDFSDEEFDNPVRVYEVSDKYPSEFTGTSFGNTMTYLDYDTGISALSSYGTDYIKFTNNNRNFLSGLSFNGDDGATVPTWITEDMDNDGDKEWYSTTGGALSDLMILTELDLSTAEEAILSFETYFSIEPVWDFGFVQVYDESLGGWISLANEYTTEEHDPNAHPDIIASLPGLTGESGEWINMAFDLSEYLGDVVQIRIRYMTDWGTELPGWWIDDIALNGEIIDNADDLITFGFPPKPDTNFEVTFIRVDYFAGTPIYWLINSMNIEQATETGLELLFPYFGSSELIMLITPTKGPVDYEISIERNILFNQFCR